MSKLQLITAQQQIERKNALIAEQTQLLTDIQEILSDNGNSAADCCEYIMSAMNAGGYTIADHDEEREPELCQHCSGSGEGMADGTVCRICKGNGEI